MTNWLKFLGISVPLTIARSWLYIITTISSLLFILFPISLITYNNYYHSLIPKNSSFKIPLNFTILNNSNKIHSNIINPMMFKDIIDNELTYNFEIELSILCKPKSELYSIDKIQYEFINILNSDNLIKSSSSSSSSSIVDNDNNDGDKKMIIRKKKKRIFGDVFHKGSFILNCDPYEIYSRNNYIIPYNFKFLISPYLTKISQSIVLNFNKFKILGKNLSNMNEFQINLTNKNNNNNDNDYDFLIDDNFSFLKIEVIWTGFRYYLVKYYYSCYVIGSLIFFGIMSGFGILISYAMLYINNRKNQPIIKVKNS